MKKLCCMSLTLAARCIGALDLSTSILAINFIAGEFFTDEQRLIAFEEIKVILGMNWAKTTTSQQRVNHKWILICLTIYSIVHLICSGGLILATIFRKKAYATPWLIFEIIGLANQTSALTVYIFQHECTGDVIAVGGAAYVPVASLYLFLGTYFWLIVYSARKTWPTGSPDAASNSNYSDGIVEPHVVCLNSPKTPSVSHHNYSIFESPEPPAPSKYCEL